MRYIARDKDFSRIGTRLISGSKEYCEQYLRDYADCDLLRPYILQLARWEVSVEPTPAWAK